MTQRVVAYTATRSLRWKLSTAISRKTRWASGELRRPSFNGSVKKKKQKSPPKLTRQTRRYGKRVRFAVTVTHRRARSETEHLVNGRAAAVGTAPKTRSHTSGVFTCKWKYTDSAGAEPAEKRNRIRRNTNWILLKKKKKKKNRRRAERNSSPDGQTPKPWHRETLVAFELKTKYARIAKKHVAIFFRIRLQFKNYVSKLYVANVAPFSFFAVKIRNICLFSDRVSFTRRSKHSHAKNTTIRERNLILNYSLGISLALWILEIFRLVLRTQAECSL